MLPVQDLLMAVLIDDEPIQLAPNSALVPCLLGNSRANVFTIRTSQVCLPCSPFTVYRYTL
jgi:hypothetical protein